MKRALPLLLTLGLLGAACSDDSDEPNAQAATVATTAAPSTSAAAAGTTAAADTSAAAPATTAAAPSTTEAPTTTTAAPAPDDGYPDQPAGVPFPDATWPTGELPATVDRAAIDAAVDVAFGAPDDPKHARSIVVAQGGRIVYERYHPLDGPDTVFDSFSVAKSFTSALIGLLVTDGRLALDEPAPVPEWQDPSDPRHAITLRNLLQMSSGLQWDEAGASGESDILGMLKSPDAASYVASKPLDSPPGTKWAYSTGTTALLVGIAADELGGCAAATDFLNERLLDPIGISTDHLITDAAGCWLGGFGANMTAEDFARFGLLYLRGGQWDGEQIVPTSWIDESRVPAATSTAYGLQWWLEPERGLFRARGLFGQEIVVVPDLDLVIVANSNAGGDPFTMIDAVLSQFGLPPAG